jgi:hypothetical protein
VLLGKDRTERQEKSYKKFKKMLTGVNAKQLHPVQMSAEGKTQTLTFPVDLHRKLEKIAAKNNLSIADVIRLCLAWALPQIAKQGLLIKPGSFR